MTATGRVIVVTGGTSGIGLATVRRFSDLGDTVHCCSRHEFDAASVLGEQAALNVFHQKVDVGSGHELSGWIRSVGNRHGRIDVLVNNAAIAIRKPVEQFTLAEFQTALNVNILSAMLATQAALPFMAIGNDAIGERRVNRTIINISSLAAVDPFPGFSVYGGCKAFLETFTRALATEVDSRGIRCYALRIGAVSTPMLRSVLPDFPADQAMNPDQIADLIQGLVECRLLFDSGSAIEFRIDNACEILHSD